MDRFIASKGGHTRAGTCVLHRGDVVTGLLTHLAKKVHNITFVSQNRSSSEVLALSD